MQSTVAGIDIGGSRIKAALVDLAAGGAISHAKTFDSPAPATPHKHADLVHEFLAELSYRGPVGCTVPGVVRAGVVHTAPNLDDSWIGVSARELSVGFRQHHVVLINDADAAALAELRLGSAFEVGGTVAVLTFGTGIGSAIIHEGHVLPNTELGHIELGGQTAETWVSGRLRNDLDWQEWSMRLNSYLRQLVFLVGATEVIVGGGVSADWQHFGHLIDLSVPVAPSAFGNHAGVVGAAIAALEGWT